MGHVRARQCEPESTRLCGAHSSVQPNGGKNSFGSGFLPSVFQGVQCRSKGDPVLYVSNPKGMSRALRRKSLDALKPESHPGQGTRQPRDYHAHCDTRWLIACRQACRR